MAAHNLEAATRVSILFQHLSAEEQEIFLRQNQLQRVQKSDGVVVADPAGAPSRKHAQRIRAAEALRLVYDDPKELELVAGSKLMVMTSLPRTEEDIRAWFDALDRDHVGSVDKDTFRKMYADLESYGAPASLKQLDERLAKLKSVKDRISFDEFVVLVMSLVKQ